MATAAPRRQYRMKARAEAAAASGERMLAAAWGEFAERSYEDVRLAEIAAEAGVTIQTLHARFGTKDQLFVAAWHRRVAPEGELRDTAPAGDVDTAVHLIHGSYERDGDAVLRLIAEEDRIPAVKTMTDAGRTWHRGWVERTFAPFYADLAGAARERRIVSIVVATDLLVWKLLRREMKLGRRTAERIVVDMVHGRNGDP
jgi:AcrR family transcriptional regulator